MGVLVLNREGEREAGLRPLDILRDLDGIGRLINIAFAEDIAREGSDMRRDLLLLTAASPLLWTLRRLSADLRDALDGFVWLEDGSIVGNVTLTREDARRRVWTISNVAVHPSYRRRGIARALMQASLDAVASRGGGPVVLEVRADNAGAYELYKRLGFQFVDGTVTTRSRAALPRPLPLAGQARRVRAGQMAAIYDLLLATRSALAQQIAPLRREDYQTGALKEVSSALAGLWLQQQRFWLGVEERGAYIAAARLHLRAFGSSTVDLVIHPAGRGRSEEQIVQSALALCNMSDSITVRAGSEQAEALAVLRSYGFSELRNLHRLMIGV